MRNEDKQDPKRPQPVRSSKKSTGGVEAREAPAGGSNDLENGRHRHV